MRRPAKLIRKRTADGVGRVLCPGAPGVSKCDMQGRNGSLLVVAVVIPYGRIDGSGPKCSLEEVVHYSLMSFDDISSLHLVARGKC